MNKAVTKQQFDTATSDFISIASHQLRTPLTAIKGFASLLLEGAYGEVQPKQLDVLKKIYDSNQKLVGLVDDLLNISRMETGRMDFAFALCRLDDICQKVIDANDSKAREKGLYLEYIKPEIALPKIKIDGDRTKEVIANMVDNALKYTQKGGAKLKIEQVDDNIKVTVSDTGMGVLDDEMPYLFTKFSRGKDTKRMNVNGIGLGLYVGKFVVEAHGGKIWAESEGENRGSRFILELPVNN